MGERTRDRWALKHLDGAEVHVLLPISLSLAAEVGGALGKLGFELVNEEGAVGDDVRHDG